MSEKKRLASKRKYFIISCFRLLFILCICCTRFRSNKRLFSFWFSKKNRQVFGFHPLFCHLTLSRLLLFLFVLLHWGYLHSFVCLAAAKPLVKFDGFDGISRNVGAKKSNFKINIFIPLFVGFHILYVSLCDFVCLGKNKKIVFGSFTSMNEWMNRKWIISAIHAYWFGRKWCKHDCPVKKYHPHLLHYTFGLMKYWASKVSHHQIHQRIIRLFK